MNGTRRKRCTHFERMNYAMKIKFIYLGNNNNMLSSLTARICERFKYVTTEISNKNSLKKYFKILMACSCQLAIFYTTTVYNIDVVRY